MVPIISICLFPLTSPQDLNVRVSSAFGNGGQNRAQNGQTVWQGIKVWLQQVEGFRIQNLRGADQVIMSGAVKMPRGSNKGIW